MADARGHTLTLSGINHRFGPVVAARDINMEIAAGELVALLGPSGCGKTTLLRIIAGFLNQSEGDVLVDGVSVSHLPPNRRQVGIVFQNYALFPHMTVAENIAYGLQAQKRPKAEIAPRVEEMLDLVQMGEFAGRFPRQMSGGQQQRIALARCLAVGPRLLLLDEPFGALDKNLRLDMQIEIKNLQRRSGITTVLVTHDQEEALSMADRIAVLQKGTIEQFAAPTEIYDQPASLFVNSFVGTTNLLPGTLQTRNAGSCVVALDAGGTLKCKTPTTCAVGDRVIFSVRPEKLNLDADRKAGGVAGTVRAVMPLGPSIVYEVVLNDGVGVKIVEERGARRAALAPGQEISLSPASAKSCAVFAETAEVAA